MIIYINVYILLSDNLKSSLYKSKHFVNIKTQYGSNIKIRSNIFLDNYNCNKILIRVTIIKENDMMS